MTFTDDESTVSHPQEGARILNALRIEALREVDGAQFIWFHRKVTLVAGVGFFTDAYDIFAINMAAIMLGYVYGHTPDPYCRPSLNPAQDLGLKIATPVGTLFGQLFFGWFADIVGRKKMYGVELVMMIVGTFAQATAADGQAMNIIAILIFWRFIVGLGVGGDYPLSATIASEFAPTRHRGRMMTGVFSAQGWGTLAASIVATFITIAYKEKISSDFPLCTLTCPTDPTQRLLCSPKSGLNHVDYMWRLLLGLGCVPGAIALYFRLTIPETPRFTMDIERNVARATAEIHGALNNNTGGYDPYAVTQRADAPRATRRDFLHFFGQRDNLLMLFGTAWSWFAIDVAFYTLSLNSSLILEAIKFGGSPDVYKNLYNLCIGNLILSLAGLIPGYLVCFVFIDSWGRKPIQLMGFAVLTCLFTIMASSFNRLIPFEGATTPGSAVPSKTVAFVFLYCLANFFQNFGPNTTSFIIPGEIFPTRYRATAHGISAATGKLGAIVAQCMFINLDPISKPQKNLALSFGVLAVFMLTGVGSTLLVPETKGISLEVLSNESQEGFMRPPPRRINVQDGVVIPLQDH
ncbi:Phosphate permease [Mycena venus]|uniref:Phosphate permease n=1 Tax=Mycena venus TaxID=2733690 RepID=A0A8H7D015_9AGAR|nr:Phosphate permease [Mycena venus]